MGVTEAGRFYLRHGRHPDEVVPADHGGPSVPVESSASYGERPVARARRAKARELVERLLAEGHVRFAHIRLGDVPVDLPEPLADLALQQVAVRRSHAVLARTPSPWLFPGGQPGRPISAWAMGERLRKLGIRLAETRSTALFQLATELPAAVLARTLGIHITVAVKWQRAAAGDWGAYAAEISRRPMRK